MSSNKFKYVQSCITTVSFPETLDGVLNMLKINAPVARWSTDLDILLNPESPMPVFWTAPKWLTAGDVIFFYHAKRAKARTRRVLAETEEKFPRKRSLLKVLRRAKETADRYAGKIFACASVSGATRRFGEQDKHFVSRLYAPAAEIRVFREPLPQEQFNDFVKIGLSTITPLGKRDFGGIKKLLAARSELPPYLERAALGDAVFKNINAKNWRSISCASETKFIHEAQLRSYFADFFLNELKDRGTTVLEECECFRGARNTGRSDYFVKIAGRWIPVEPKLDISREKNLLAQTAKYTNIDYFVPRKGAHRDRIFVAAASPCLVLDESGVYLVSARGEFVKCRAGRPKWRRERLTADSLPKIRRMIADAG